MNAQELLNQLAAGNAARQQLDKICEAIYDEYLALIETKKKAIEAVDPCWDGYLSELERCNQGYHSFKLTDGLLRLTGSDYFRCEHDYETDDLPRAVLTATPAERTTILQGIVTKKGDVIRAQLAHEEQEREAQNRASYEILQAQFEPKA